MGQLLELLEKRNGILEQWRDLYEQVQPGDELLTTKTTGLTGAYDRLDVRMKEQYPSLVSEGGWLDLTEGLSETGGRELIGRIRDEEHKRERLLRDLAERNRAYMKSLEAFREELEEELKDVQKRKQMSNGYRSTMEDDAVYVDEKR